MNNALNNLDFATLTILAKEVAKAQKEVRKNTEAGEFTANGTVTLDVNGTVKVGEDFEQRIVLKADPFTLLTVALSHLNGVTIESIVEEALTADPEMVKSIKAKAQGAWEAINAPTLTHCKGKVTMQKGAEVTVNTGLVVND